MVLLEDLKSYLILYSNCSYGHEVCFIITAKEAPEYTKNIEDFKNLALKMNVPFETSPNIAKYEKLIKKTKPEIGVSINYTKIIPQKIIDLFPLGILNAHGGDLPKYRGNACKQSNFKWRKKINCAQKFGRIR